MTKRREGTFRRGLITCEWLRTYRGAVTAPKLKEHLERYGESVDIRTAQRYLIEAEALRPIAR